MLYILCGWRMIDGGEIMCIRVNESYFWSIHASNI